MAGTRHREEPLLGGRSDLEVPVVEVGVVEVAAMPALPALRERRDPDRLALANDGAKGLHLDEPVTEIDHATLDVGRDAADAQIRPSETQHPTRVHPTQARRLLADEDDDMVPRNGTGRLKGVRPPFVRTPPLEHVRIEDGDAAAIEERGHEADRMAEVIERLRVLDNASEHEALLGRGRPCEERGVLASKLVAAVAIQTEFMDVGPRFTFEDLELAPVGDARAAILRARDGGRAAEGAVEL